MRVKARTSIKSLFGRGEIEIEAEADTMELVKELLEIAASLQLKMS